MNVLTTNGFYNLTLPPKSLQAGDTLAIYIQMANSASTLNYKNSGTTLTRDNDELYIFTGSGSSYNFGGSFFPRNWNGEIFYHYGFNPDGECITGKQPVTAEISKEDINLGTDTVITTSLSITLDAGNDFSNYQWTNGDNTSSIDINVPTNGTYIVWCIAVDKFGCAVSDTIELTFEVPGIGIASNEQPGVRVWPNPFNDVIYIDAEGEFEVRMYNSLGQLIFHDKNESGISTIDLPPGIYVVVVKDSSGASTLRMVK
ncbi:MAG: T9SS type A sorting domain-containing protein [Bacteroidetes bacterium]|nr:T9SS type A sorting domain-containing protein [Bacteroidota bacterium]